MCFSKEPPTHRSEPGLSTYLALTFGTLLSSQGTDASFVLTLSGFPPGASLRCFFCSCVSDSIRLFRVRFPRCLSGSRSGLSAFAFPFPAVPTLSDPFGPDPRSAGFVFAAVGPFRRVRL
ncbi:hypothetical protein DEJ47_21410 [Streptomyces venezuelae]|uniref:Uncharacterized protein n=1 Tax=Streptomyces venezuelae TaxID=54571 RepID=A0A5P2BE85_STRVZ|nr:hypothetical protein DEJ47_21410 [Streptomyces venezuelae]